MPGRRVHALAIAGDGQEQISGEANLTTDASGLVRPPKGRWKLVYDGDELYDGCSSVVEVSTRSPSEPHVGKIVEAAGIMMAGLAMFMVWWRLRGSRRGHGTISRSRSTLVTWLGAGRERLTTYSGDGSVMPEVGFLVVGQGSAYRGVTDTRGRATIPGTVLPGTIFLFTPRGLVASVKLGPHGPYDVTVPEHEREVLEAFFTLLELLGEPDARLKTPRQALDSGLLAREVAAGIEQCAFGDNCESDLHHFANYLKSLINQTTVKNVN